VRGDRLSNSVGEGFKLRAILPARNAADFLPSAVTEPVCLPSLAVRISALMQRRRRRES
jgi:hypothetical protein